MTLIIRDRGQSELLEQKRSLFLHVPKTGGTWIKTTLRNHCPNLDVREPVVDPRCQHVHPLPEAIREDWDFSFTFVRHPLTWLESWWKFQHGTWSKHGSKVFWPIWELEPCASDDFSTFIRNYLKLCPGHVTRMYEWYVGPKRMEKVDFIGCYESLYEDLSSCLKQCGQELSSKDLAGFRRINASKPVVPKWDDGLRREVAIAEGPAIRRFYPNGDLVRSA